jgi:xanthine/uracil/vitamin C permease (AzgA family)
MGEMRILMLIGSSLGVIYRGLYTNEINTISKFIASLLLSIFIGIAWMLYVEENNIKPSFAIISSLILGLLTTSIAAVILKIGKKSEDKLSNELTQYLSNFIPKTNKQNNSDDELRPPNADN